MNRNRQYQTVTIFSSVIVAAISQGTPTTSFNVALYSRSWSIPKFFPSTESKEYHINLVIEWVFR